MDNLPDTLDWSLIPAFLAVADTGSLSAAARRLGTSQPTIGRQIKQLEDQVATPLFTRHPRGLVLSPAGRALLPAAHDMQTAARALSLTAAGQDQTLRGTVRLTASKIVAHYILPPIIAQIRRAEPQIAIDLVPSDSAENLLFREADIALRMFRSTQLDIVTRHLGDLPVAVFAARRYLDRHGRPETPEQMLTHSLIGYDRSDLILRGMRDLGYPATREWFAIRCDDQPTYFELVRAGCGLGFGQRHLIDRDPELEVIDLNLPIPGLPLWLAAPQATRHTPRIARIWDLLTRALPAVLS
ncbi:LysR family transcriptional regulator [Lacimonas salitolerans]|uniref:LysR family transcriptional regulator n=1 Tax=Lacimonas salitolerans TaxID=1323750 RepID=A0ABW4EIN3_9RHOB